MAPRRNPAQAESIQALREQYPSRALLKIYRVFDDGTPPSWIPPSDGGTFHVVDWDVVSSLEPWLLAHPLCGPGYAYKVVVHTADDNGKPSKSAQATLTTVKIQSPAFIAAQAFPQRQAEAQAEAQLHAATVVAEVEKVQQQVLAEAPRVFAAVEEAMSSPDPVVQAQAQAQADAMHQKLRESQATLAASLQSFASVAQRVAMPGATPIGALPAPAPAYGATPPGVAHAGYSAAMPGGMGMGMGAAVQPTPYGMVIPGVGLVPWSALQGAGGFGASAPAAPAQSAELAALNKRLEEAERRAAMAEQESKLEKQRRESEAQLAEERRRNDERFAAQQRESAASLERVQTEFRAQIATLTAQTQAQAQAQVQAQAVAQQKQPDPMLTVLPLFQTMMQQAQQSSDRMMTLVAGMKNDDASAQVRQAAGAMGEVMQTSMQAVSQLVRMQAAPAGSPTPTWLPLVMRAIDTVGGMGAALMQPAAAAPQVQQPQQAHMQPVPPVPQLPPAQAPAGQLPAVPPGAPAQVAQPQQPPVPPPNEVVSTNAQAQAHVNTARAGFASGQVSRYVEAMQALQDGFTADPEMQRVGESFVDAAQRVLGGYVAPDVLQMLAETILGQYPALGEKRQPPIPQPPPQNVLPFTGASAPATA